jgi:RimJ/RimL family protein N-acetyltransferase
MADLLPLKTVLADGTAVEVRAIRPDDREELAREFARLSPASRYARFLAAKGSLADDELRFLTEVDGHDHVAIVAVSESPDLKREVGLGVARFIRLPNTDVAEAAVTVSDAAQNRGLGRVLLQVLASLAQAESVRAFRSEVLSENRRMRKIMEDAGGTVVEDHGATIVIDVPIEPLPDAGAEHREHPLRRILRAAAEAIAALRPAED